MKTFIFLITTLFLSGCASRIPQNISQAPRPNLTIAEVVVGADVLKNQLVRWGGSILTVTNHSNDTEIEILAKKLDSSGKPVESDVTSGRFLARTKGYADPAVYAQGRMLTVYGLVDSVLTREIGEKPYVYPVIQAKMLYVWPSESEYTLADDCSSDYGVFGYYYNFGYYPYGAQYCMNHSW